MKYTNSLKKLGLTEEQAKIYEILINNPKISVRLISIKSGVNREHTYFVLQKLEEKGFVERSKEDKLIKYSAINPLSLKKVVEEKKGEFENSQNEYQNVISDIVADFNIANNKPFVRFYEGLSGLQKIYDHSTKTAKKIYIFRSPFDYENDDIREMIKKQIERQSKNKIETFILSPKLDHMGDIEKTHNTGRNSTRKIIPKDQFNLPAQIIVYNDSVGITTMRDEITTTLVENKDIADSFRILFEKIWDSN